MNIGLGLDYNHFPKYFLGGWDLIESLKNDLSHVSIVGIENKEVAKKFKEKMNEKPILHHFTGVEPAGVEGLNLSRLKQQLIISQILNPEWCLEDVGIWSIGPYAIPYFTPPVFTNETLDMLSNGVKKIQSKSDYIFAAEVPSCSFMAGDIDLCLFFKRLCCETNCKVVLDVSHIYSYSIYKDINIHHILEEFPLDNVIEFHIAGGSVHPAHKWRYRDTHSDPILNDIFLLLEVLISNCKNLKAITYEIGVNLPKNVFESDFQKLNYICEKSGFKSGL